MKQSLLLLIFTIKPTFIFCASELHEKTSASVIIGSHQRIQPKPSCTQELDFGPFTFHSPEAPLKETSFSQPLVSEEPVIDLTPSFQQLVQESTDWSMQEPIRYPVPPQPASAQNRVGTSPYSNQNPSPYNTPVYSDSLTRGQGQTTTRNQRREQDTVSISSSTASALGMCFAGLCSSSRHSDTQSRHSSDSSNLPSCLNCSCPECSLPSFPDCSCCSCPDITVPHCPDCSGCSMPSCPECPSCDNCTCPDCGDCDDISLGNFSFGD